MRPAHATAAPPLASAIYEGVVRHRRHVPHPHSFSYRMAQLYLDLDELDSVFDRRWLWSVGRRNVAEFRRSDYFGPSGTPLVEAVRHCAQQVTGRRPGPVRLLTHLRYVGYAFNPVSFYYCYAADGASLECIIAEITNTPWRERHAYVLPVSAARRIAHSLDWTFDKTFHVSPFMAMNRKYDWHFTEPAERLAVHMNVRHEEQPEFDATLSLQRRPLDAASLSRILWRYPLMTVQVISAIHWQALRLWLKRNPVHTHPGHAMEQP